MTAKKTKAEEAAEATYKVAEGVAITSKRGMLKAGAAVEAGFLSGGQASLDKLLKSEKIVKS